MAKRRVYEAKVRREEHPDLVFMWFVDDNDERVPVLPNPDGTVRLVFGDDDQISLCDLLEGIMDLRALGAWQPPTEYDAGCSERMVQPGQGKWGPANWSSIPFSGVNLNQRYYRDDIAYYRRRAPPPVCPHCGCGLGVG